MHITYGMVREDLPNIIATNGGEDFVYVSRPSGVTNTCMYIWEGKPDCLLGRYLVSLGVPVEAFDDLEGSGIDSLFRDGQLIPYNFTAEPEAVHAMSKVQGLQDDGYAWGDAYARVFEPDIDH